jgi:hypothetical protein
LAATVKDANPAQADRMPRLITLFFRRLFKATPSPLIATIGLFAVALCAGCTERPVVRQYTVSGKVPAELLTIDRMLGAIVPRTTEAWFFKVVGPTPAIAAAESQIREFLSKLKFTDQGPDLANLPTGWNSGGKKAMRFATLLIDTPDTQLDLSISMLPISGEWDEQVVSNVNRWRGQMKLPPSTEKWAGAVPIEIAAAEAKQAIWVDLTGQMGANPSMSPIAAIPPAPDSNPNPPDLKPAPADASPIKFATPEGWRPGKMSMMRLAAFNIGPEDDPAELTIIQAGGDLRGNVARWLGQVRGDSPPDSVVGEAMAASESIQVSGRPGQRYYLDGGEANATPAQAIDATIVPMETGMSVFIKATGSPKTIKAEKERIGEFIRSLQIP